MIEVLMGLSLVVVSLFLIVIGVTIVDQELDGLITKKIIKRFGGDE